MKLFRVERGAGRSGAAELEDEAPSELGEVAPRRRRPALEADDNPVNPHRVPARARGARWDDGDASDLPDEPPPGWARR